MAKNKVRQAIQITRSKELIDQAIRALGALNAVGSPDAAMDAYKDNKTLIEQTIDNLSARSFALQAHQNHLVVTGF